MTLDDQVCRMFEAGLTYREIGRQVGRANTIIASIVRARGLRRDRPNAQAGRPRKPCSERVNPWPGCECVYCRRNVKRWAKRESTRQNELQKAVREERDRPPEFWMHCDRKQPVGPCVTCGSQPGWVKTAS